MLVDQGLGKVSDFKYNFMKVKEIKISMQAGTNL